MDEVEWYKTSGSFDFRTISPLRRKQHMIPVGLMVVDDTLQHGFEDFVDSLNLPIGLRVVQGSELMGEV